MYDSLGSEGVLSICSASNFGHSVEKDGDLPALCSSAYTIIVTNVDEQDRIVDNAAYGRISVDIGAPGEQSFTTNAEGYYSYFWGTSAAAPYVTGTVGLLYSVDCPLFFDHLDTDPDKTALKIKNIILATGSSNSSLEGITLSGRRLQADAAISGVLAPCINMDKESISIRFVRASPNNNRDIYVNFEFTHLKSGLEISLYSSNGVRVYTRRLNDSEMLNGIFKVDTDSLVSGIYFLSLEGSNSVSTSKILVN